MRWGAGVATGIVLASCSSGVTITKAEGTISVETSRCPTRHVTPVTVAVLEDSALRTSAAIRPGSQFEFHLSPGHYVLTTGSDSSHVTLGAGDTVKVVFLSVCARST